MGTKGEHPFIALDVETTGLDRERDQILQIGATAYGAGSGAQLMYFVEYPRYSGGAFALAMNQKIFERLAKGDGVSLVSALQSLDEFVRDHCCKKPHPVGFNIASFDLMMLKRAWDPIGLWPFHHRAIEIGSLWARPDGRPTSSAAMAALRGKEVTHDALQDALDARSYHEEWMERQKK